MRIVFAGTPEFAAIQLKALLQTPAFNVVAVYTQPDKPAGRGQHMHMSPVKELALEHQIPVEQPSTLKTEEAVSILKKFDADVMVVAAYGLLLPKAILDTPLFGCINVHASLLPRWRGASPIQQAILAGDKESGITLMQMDIGLDTGDILAQQAYTLKQEETSQSLHDQLALIGAKLLSEKLQFISSLAKQKQTESLVTHAGKIKKEDALINWHDSALNIDRKIRAYYPWPIAYSALDSQLIRLWQATPVEGKGEPGEIIAHTSLGIIIACQDGAILLTQAQLPGKKMMPLSELLKGHAALFAIGNKLG